MSTSPVIRHARRARAFNLAAVSFSAASALLQVLAFHQVTFWVPVLLVFAAVNVFCAAAGTRNLRRLQARARRPDYAVIARLERGIWGQAFEHAGAPASLRGLEEGTHRLGVLFRASSFSLGHPAPETTRTHAPARGCGGYHLGTAGSCGTCKDYHVTMTSVGPVGPVRACCGTTPGTGHRGTCSQSMMNGGTEVGIADLAAPLRFPILSQDVLDEVARHLEREITRHFGIPPAHLARICECGRSPVLAQGLCGPCYRLALYAGRLPGRR